MDFPCRGCIPSFRDCSYTSDSYSEQMKQFWWYTKDRYLCNEYMHNMYFGDIADPDLNPKCLMLHDQHLHFAQPQNGHTPQQIVISKKSTERRLARIRASAVAVPSWTTYSSFYSDFTVLWSGCPAS